MSKTQSKKKKVLKIILVVVEILILAGLAVGYYIYSKMDKVQKGVEVTKTEVKIDEKVDEKISKGYLNIALFGLDNRQKTFQSGNSDVILIASINQDTNEVKLMSIYRDTLVNLETEGKDQYFKANDSYNLGGPQQALRMLNSNFDLNITKYVAFNFDAVAEVVDALGGVELEITDRQAILMQGYQEDVEAMTGKPIEKLYKGGKYTLNGEQTASFARIRKDEDDFQRTKRQREIISQLFEKAKKASITTLNSLLDDVLANYVETNLGKSEMLELLSDVTSYTLGDTVGFPFDKNSAIMQDPNHPNDKPQECVVSCDLISNVQQMHALLFNDKEYEPTDGVKELNDIIKTKTGLTKEDAIIQQENGENKIDAGLGSDTSGSESGSTETSGEGETSSSQD